MGGQDGRGGRGGRQPSRSFRTGSTALTALFALTALLACSSPRTTNGSPVRVSIPPNATFRAVTDTLIAHGVVHSPLWFRVLARLRHSDRAIQVGTYDIPAGATAWDVLTLLQDGRVVTEHLTVPEGLTLLDLAALAEAELSMPADSLITAARDPELRKTVRTDAGTLEGYLLPETYQLPLGASPGELVRAMVAQFVQRWDPTWDRRLDSLRMTRDQILALASIVEGEARHDEERPVIAGVYSNRLRTGMPLQADPTVQYGIQLQTGVRKTRLYFKDYDTPSPFNTYLHPGLPPGPINSPGLASIRAALYPADVPYLYFVARPDGFHVFSRTLEEHNRAIAAVRRGK